MYWTLAELAEYCERNAIYIELDADRKLGFAYNLDGSAAGLVFELY